MGYTIFFDESNKIDQPKGTHAFYGALGGSTQKIEELEKMIMKINKTLRSESELHFVNYRKGNLLKKYFNVLVTTIQMPIRINVMLVNKNDAKQVAEKMDLTLVELRNLFYVKLPERLFYGMTRDLQMGEKVQIVIDENAEYDLPEIDLVHKLSEQMNAHSAYRNKGYKVCQVEQVSSEESIGLQLVDVWMGIAIFLIEKAYKNEEGRISNTAILKSDLIYRLLIEEDIDVV